MPRSQTRNMYAVSFGLIMRRLRLERGLTILRISQLTGMNPKYLGTVESGGNVPSVDTLIRISNALGVPPPEVLREMIESHAAVAGRKT